MFRQKAPRLVTIAILTTITIVCWVFFSLYQILTKKQNVEVPAELLEPIDPTLDSTTLNSIQSRLFFEEGQVEALPANKPVNTSDQTFIPVPTEQPEPTPETEINQ